MGIGTTTIPIGYKSVVEDKVILEEVKVDLALAWPDDVFKPTYELTGLEDLQHFIETHHHLPEMPSATEVAENGIQLGEMQGKLLEKIEGLTLYLIEQNEKNT